jgi:two-component system LytT family response regulator
MKSIRCFAVDDEPLALTILNDYVSKVPFLSMEKTFNSATEAAKDIESLQPDILFLDIEMPDIRGIDFIKTLNYKPAIILTTAYAEYALQGFELDVTDYLLKPIPFDRFLQAVNKVVRNMESSKTNTAENEKDFLFAKTGYKSVKINYKDILYIEGLKEYVGIHTEDARFLKLDSLLNLEKSLPSDKFLRVHKSFIINIDHVKSHFGNTIEISGKEIPIGRVYKERILKTLK